MKKLILLIFIIMLIASAAVFADATTSEFYVKTIQIAKIYDHNLGYRVVYTKSDNKVRVIYLPKGWFQTAAQSGETPKAEMILGKDRSYPYFSVFWKNGEFSHLRLYLQIDLNHDSWGDIDPSWDLTGKFDVDTLVLD